MEIKETLDMVLNNSWTPMIATVEIACYGIKTGCYYWLKYWLKNCIKNPADETRFKDYKEIADYALNRWGNIVVPLPTPFDLIYLQQLKKEIRKRVGMVDTKLDTIRD